MTLPPTPKYVRCPQGHVFDRSRNPTCPTCSPAGTGAAVQTGPKPQAVPDTPRENVVVRRPGGELYSRPLHFIWLVDCSGSMMGEKMASLNYAIRSVLPEMQEAARDNPNVQVLVRVLEFSNSAQWHSEEPVPVGQFTWADLDAVVRGETHLGEALHLLAAALASPPLPAKALPPVLVLLTDGQSTDDFDAGLQAVLAQDGGAKAVRISIAIGSDAYLPALEKFNSPGIEPFRAHNATELVAFIKWASTSLLAGAGAEGPIRDLPQTEGGPTLW